VNWVLDADIRGFFDNMSHEWTMKFIEHRVADRRILRLIQKWLRAGVSEDGQWSETTVGTPQGAVASPLLANVYLHYVFDLWVEVWRKKAAKGDVIVVRYADDLVLGFQPRTDAEPELKEIIRTAHTRRLPVTGHIPRTLTMTHAVELGMEGLEHIRITGREMLPVDEANKIDFLPFAKRETRLWQQFEPQSEKMRRLVQFLATSNVVLDPTIVADENVFCNFAA
jgi:hypothetical protein